MAAIAALTFGVVMHVQAVETVSATPTATTQHPKPAKTTETAAPAFSRPNAQAATAFSLMTPEERKAYRAKMRTLKTPQERQAYRLENRKMMEQALKNTEKFVQQFLNYPSAQQVPLAQLASNFPQALP